MLRNYFRIGYRHLTRNRVFSLINILGLAVSVAAFLLVMQYVGFQFSYDQFHTNKDQIYRVALEFSENGEVKNTSAKNYHEIKEILREHFPQIDDVTAFVTVTANTGFLFRHGDKLFNEPGGFLQADSDFFKVFPSLLLRGHPETALDNPNSLVISESIARKIFGDVDPIGKLIGNVNEVKDGGDYVVTGILRDIPKNAHFHANFIGVANLAEWGNYQEWSWFFYTYITIPRHIDDETIRERVTSVNAKLQALRTETKGARVVLQPITDIHLHSHLIDELEANGNSTLVYVLIGIGVLILVIAWINYINLETARYTVRAKEVGIRRIVGSAKADLALQFLVEYLLITIAALGVAWLILQLSYPYVAYVTGLEASLWRISTPLAWLSALFFIGAGSAFVGVYPSFFLMRLDPVNVLKGKASGMMRGRGLRKALVIVQFTASIGLISFLLIIYQQLDHILQSNRKINLDKVVAIRNPTAYMNQESETKLQEFNALENKLLQHPSIEDLATSSAIPGTEIGFTYVDLIKRDVGAPYDPTRYKTLFIDYNFIPLYGLKLLAGRNYSQNNGEDENWQTLILNEKAIRQLGFKSPEDAIGQEVQFMAVEQWDKYKIIGVVENYHHQAVKNDVFPMIFFLNHNLGQQVYYSIKLSANSDPEIAVQYIEKCWKDIFPEKPLEYFFIDNYYNQQFKSERYFSRIFTVFASIAVVVGCLGILGMTLFEANVRLKELSIRKVLGASRRNLITLLAQDHIRTLSVAALTATPIIYLVATEWLNQYPTRIELSTWVFVIPLLVLFALVVITSGFQTIKAANANPVDHLKHE